MRPKCTIFRSLPCVPQTAPRPHLPRSKADEVESEADRQRVLIQITQNLATRIRNSHAFNLPTFYLPHEDGLPCTIRERRAAAACTVQNQTLMRPGIKALCRAPTQRA